MKVAYVDTSCLVAALYLAGDPAAISFLTLDERQATVARALGFPA